MDVSGVRGRVARAGLGSWIGGLVSVAVAVALFTRFGLDGTLSRDEAMYAYPGQQLAHGVPPYASVFDPKGPLAAMVAGLGAALGNAAGAGDLVAIRVAFFVVSCATVLAVFLLAQRLWRSTTAGVVAAVAFASFRGFAADALSGPDAKTPGVLCLVASMWLLLRGRWFWAGAAGSLAFLVWQPLVVFPVVAVLFAPVGAEAGRRRRAAGLAAAGVAAPLVATAAYFAAVGALSRLVGAAFVFPLTGIHRARMSVLERLDLIATVVHRDYRASGLLFWAGLSLLLALTVALLARHRGHPGRALRSPLVLVVGLTGLAQAGYAAVDFQGYPDLYPLLPYAALGLGGAAALAVGALRGITARRAVTAAVLVAATGLVGVSWTWFGSDPMNDGGLRAQRADACGLTRMLGRTGSVYALGDPTPLVLTGRRNPDRFVYLASGVDRWKIRHTAGGFAGWTAQIAADRPQVVVIRGWHTRVRHQLGAWLHSAGYRWDHLGRWGIYATRHARERALNRDVRPTPTATAYAAGPGGRELPVAGCGQPLAAHG